MMQKINHEILVWARETAGLDLQDAVRKLAITDGYGKTAIERLEQLENGNKPPSRSLLVRMAKCYRRPLITFYLEKPPKKGQRGQDFRTLPIDYNQKDDALLDALLRNIKVRQYLVRAVLEDEEAIKVPFIASLDINDGVDSVVKSIKTSLNFDLNEYRARKNTQDAFEFLRNKAQASGIFVLLIGNLGSHYSNISTEIFRGIADSDPIAPFIVINDHDAKTAWSFTLLHELAHLWLGQSGVSGGYGELKIERFCNEVAAEILLPSTEIKKLNINLGTPVDNIKATITNFIKTRHLSRTMVAYRLYRHKKINLNTWNTLRDVFLEEWRTQRLKQKEKWKRSTGGPNYYSTHRHKLGNALIALVSRTISEGVLTPTKAGKILGVKPRSVDSLVNISPVGSP